MHDDLLRLELLLLCHLQQCEQVRDVAVDAAVGDQPHEVQTLAGPPHFAHDFQQHRVAEEAAVADSERDAHEVLVGHASGAKVLVADFAVAHLSGWQADRFARCLQQRVRIRAQELIEHRQVRQQDRVAMALGALGVFIADAPAVADDQDKRFHLLSVRGRKRLCVRSVSTRLPSITASAHRKPAR